MSLSFEEPEGKKMRAQAGEQSSWQPGMRRDSFSILLPHGAENVLDIARVSVLI